MNTRATYCPTVHYTYTDQKICFCSDGFSCVITPAFSIPAFQCPRCVGLSVGLSVGNDRVLCKNG